MRNNHEGLAFLAGAFSMFALCAMLGLWVYGNCIQAGREFEAEDHYWERYWWPQKAEARLKEQVRRKFREEADHAAR